jgi:hypothetical protein
MSDLALLEQEGVPDEDPARAQPAGDLREQPPVEEADHDHRVGRPRTDARRVEVHLHARDARIGRPGAEQPRAGDVERDHAVPARGEERGVGPRARGDVERDAGPQEPGVLHQERRGLCLRG